MKIPVIQIEWHHTDHSVVAEAMARHERWARVQSMASGFVNVTSVDFHFDEKEVWAKLPPGAPDRLASSLIIFPSDTALEDIRRGELLVAEMARILGTGVLLRSARGYVDRVPLPAGTVAAPAAVVATDPVVSAPGSSAQVLPAGLQPITPADLREQGPGQLAIGTPSRLQGPSGNLEGNF